MVDNHGLIAADNGNIVMTAWARDALARAVVNNTGRLEARGIDQLGGITLTSVGAGDISVAGTFDAGSRGAIDAQGGDVRFDTTLRTGGSLDVHGKDVLAANHGSPWGAGNQRSAIEAGGDVSVMADRDLSLGKVSGRDVELGAAAGIADAQWVSAAREASVAGDMAVHVGRAEAGTNLVMQSRGDVAFDFALSAGGDVNLGGMSITAAQRQAYSYYYGVAPSWDGFGSYASRATGALASIRAGGNVAIVANHGDVAVGQIDARNANAFAERGSILTQAINATDTIGLSAAGTLGFEGDLRAGGRIDLDATRIAAREGHGFFGPNGTIASIDSSGGDVSVKAADTVSLGKLGGNNVKVFDGDGQVPVRWHSNEYGNMFAFDEQWPMDARHVGTVEGFDGPKPLIANNGGYVIATAEGPRWVSADQVQLWY